LIRVAILGATGSIGRSALEIVRRHPDLFTVEVLTGHRNVALLRDQVAEFRPAVAVLTDGDVDLPADGGSSRWFSGREAILDAVTRPDVDVVLNALVGAAGLEPTLAALGEGKRLALANKESLVAGGDLVLEAARVGGGELVPIDSEHSAILQCLEGGTPESVHRLILTASGGPFRGRTRNELAKVGPADALRHPTWDMGAKITIDSATLANKALEVIEAHHLYGLSYDRIDAVIHPQSIIHSMVEFVDGSVLSQMGFPTMELPILYALTYPQRVADDALRTFDPVRASPLTFEPIDHEAFPLFRLGVSAGARGGAAAAVYNAGNEVAVQAFLKESIGFLEMCEVIEVALDRLGGHPVRGLADVLEVDREARILTAEAVRDGGRSKAGVGTSP